MMVIREVQTTIVPRNYTLTDSPSLRRALERNYSSYSSTNSSLLSSRVSTSRTSTCSTFERRTYKRRTYNYCERTAERSGCYSYSIDGSRRRPECFSYRNYYSRRFPCTNLFVLY
ncbi:uncharacterized protein LOC132197355 [Neocloeon triangulifer]|uniref:uncharacterized protein LOC132197355 n=1 Tax=Neocloeon triangulifer TaxID=2078957 RepID=UPI00286F818F|nr:uncharacterized protein LOC132197355 [Neocloeon triangulifer]